MVGILLYEHGIPIVKNVKVEELAAALTTSGRALPEYDLWVLRVGA